MVTTVASSRSEGSQKCRCTTFASEVRLAQMQPRFIPNSIHRKGAMPTKKTNQSRMTRRTNGHDQQRRQSIWLRKVNIRHLRLLEVMAYPASESLTDKESDGIDVPSDYGFNDEQHEAEDHHHPLPVTHSDQSATMNIVLVRLLVEF